MATEKEVLDPTNMETRLAVRVTPGAKRNSITGFTGGVWRIKIAAPPVEGKANEALVNYLSEVLGVRKSSFSLMKGETNRNKLLSVKGITPEEIATKLSEETGD